MRKPLGDKQAWFWTKRWQEGEREAEADIRTGRIHRFDNVKDAIAFLHRRAESARKTKAKNAGVRTTDVN